MAIVGPDSVWPIARRAFERAMQIDSQPISIGHLPYIAVRSRDTVLARHISRFYEHLEGEDTWATRWVIAGMLSDAPQLARLRQIGPVVTQTEISGVSLMNALDATVPIALVEEGFRQVNTVANATDRDRNAMNLWLLHRARGQPAAAERSIIGQSPVYWRANLGGGSWTAFTGDLADDEAYLKAFGSSAEAQPAAERRRQCVAARVLVQRGHADSLDVPALRQAAGAGCARVLEIWKAFAANALTDAALTDLDSIVTYSTTPTFMGFEHRLLSHIYEVRGDTVRALRAIRLYPRDFPAVWLGPTLREEGRSYLLSHDTANAVRSYTHFMELRTEAEAPYIAERDSIKAIVALLTHRK